MSVQAIAWVLDNAETTTAPDRLVLLSIANHADKFGRGAFPKVSYIAQEARLADRTVTRALKRLEEQGLIARDEWPGDRKEPAANRLPKCWKLPGLGVSISHPTDSSGVTATTLRGDSHDTSGVTAPGTERALTVLEPSLPLRKRKRDPLFDELLLVCGLDYDNLTATFRSGVGKAVAEIREVWPGVDDLEPFAIAEEVVRRAGAYRRRYPGADLTPHALAKHWGVVANEPTTAPDLTYEPIQPPEPLSPEEEAAAQAAAAEAFAKWRQNA